VADLKLPDFLVVLVLHDLSVGLQLLGQLPSLFLVVITDRLDLGAYGQSLCISKGTALTGEFLLKCSTFQLPANLIALSTGMASQRGLSAITVRNLPRLPCLAEHKNRSGFALYSARKTQ